MSLTSKTALVTGGSRGIGRAICEELAARGANVVLCYAGNAEAAHQTVASCEVVGSPGCAKAYQCDVSDAATVDELVKRVIDEFGSVDILVNNAGITNDKLLMTIKEDDFDSVIDTNLKGTFLCMKAVARSMIRQRSGRIVNLSSIVGLRGNAGQASYAASKAGVIGLTKAAAKELASRSITVNAVAPGFIETDMTAALSDKAREALIPTIPLAQLGTAQDVARAVAFLASDDARYITGQVLCVDGGMAM